MKLSVGRAAVAVVGARRVGQPGAAAGDDDGAVGRLGDRGDGLRPAVGVGVVGQHVDRGRRGVLGTVLVSSTATGGSSTLVTLMVSAFSNVRPPESVVRTRTDRVGVVSKSRETAVRSVDPEIGERAVVGRAGAGDQGEDLGVARIGIGRREGADRGAGGPVLRHRRGSQAQVGGCVVLLDVLAPGTRRCPADRPSRCRRRCRERSLSLAVALSRPSRVSSPRPPPSTSLPVPPTMVSSPPPPWRTSSPPRPLILSSPPRPQMKSSWLVPRSASGPGVPMIVQWRRWPSRGSACEALIGATIQAAVTRARAARRHLIAHADAPPNRRPSPRTA